MAKHPYIGLPDTSYWRRSVAGHDGDLDPTVAAPFGIGPHDKIATAGSCFAQHIGRYLQAVDCAYLVTEPAHPLLDAETAQLCNYGVYTARYGNVYSPRQLLQLFERAYGRFRPRESIWREGAGVFLDPFRPNIQPGGFNSERELELDRDRHLQAVRTAFETLDVFVFTLGLTEAWQSREDGAVFPVCPGVSGGSFSPQRHAFVNFSVSETLADLEAFLAALRHVNPKARLVLTVSPVPLVATAEQRHVLEATVYSKSVLRVAAETLRRQATGVAYFPSYEIVSNGFAGHYFAADKRSVTEAGVAHVMRVFSAHFLDVNRGTIGSLLRRAISGKGRKTPEAAAMDGVLRVLCDEEALDMIEGPDESLASSP